MIRSDGAAVLDAGQIGLAVALPNDLQAQVRAIATEWAPVRDAVAAGWAGLDDLQIVTAALNGSAAVVRPKGVIRESGAVVLADGGGEKVSEHGRLPADSEASRVWSVVQVAGGTPAIAGGAFMAQPSAFEGGLPRSGNLVEGSTVSGESSRSRTDESLVDRIVGGGEGGAAELAPGDRLPAVVLNRRQATAARPVDRDGNMLVSGRASAETATTAAASASGSSAALSTESLGASAALDDASAPVMQAVALYADVQAVLRDRARSGMTEPQFESALTTEGRATGSAFVAGRRRSGAAGGSGAGDGGGPLPAGFETTAAPQPPERTGGEAGGGGTVMLDGRLVGQWLSEHMARDAARPGAGTTFFDPRQAPAWTPSGAL